MEDLAVVRAQRGDVGALRDLVHTHQAAVHALVTRVLITDPSSVDDVCQDALVKVVRGLSTFDPRGTAPIRRWILKIATRTALDHLRRHRRRVARTAEAPAALAGEEATPEVRVERARILARVEAAMASLPPDQRAALVLRAYHDLDYEEIADALQVRVGTVKSRIARARRALRSALERASEVSHA